MNFIENTIFPQSFDSLRKECNTALKTSPGGSKTTFLPIKLQQSIIQAAMYAASERRQEATRQGPDGKIRSTTERKIFTPQRYAGIGRIVTAGYFRSKISP